MLVAACQIVSMVVVVVGCMVSFFTRSKVDREEKEKLINNNPNHNYGSYGSDYITV